MEHDQADRPKFVVGLGNPGRQYARTRHNVGFQVVQELAQRWQASPGRRAFGGRVYDARPLRQGRSRRTLLFEPQTHMNASGWAVQELAAFHKALPADILVVLDDLALPPGRLRARAAGTAGGHKGLADVLRALGSTEVPRLRVGIGPPPEACEAADFVLSEFTRAERPAIEQAIRRAADAVEDWVFLGMEAVMHAYNRKTETPENGNDR